MKTQTIKPGEESERFSCQSCNRDFSVTLEPQMAGADKKTLKESGFQNGEVKCCPFCGDEDIDDNN